MLDIAEPVARRSARHKALSGALILSGDQLTASVPDPFNFAQNAEFQKPLVAAQEGTRPVSTLVLDVNRVTLIDSAGLGMLLLSRFDVLFKLTL